MGGGQLCGLSGRGPDRGAIRPQSQAWLAHRALWRGGGHYRSGIAGSRCWRTSGNRAARVRGNLQRLGTGLRQQPLPCRAGASPGFAVRGWIYTGVGIGIALTGTLTWLGGRQPASWLWLELGLLAAAGAFAVLAWLRPSSSNMPVGSSKPPTQRVCSAQPAPKRRCVRPLLWDIRFWLYCSRHLSPDDGASASCRSAGVWPDLAIVWAGGSAVRRSRCAMAGRLAAPTSLGTGPGNHGPGNRFIPAHARVVGTGGFSRAGRGHLHGRHDGRPATCAGTRQTIPLPCWHA